MLKVFHDLNLVYFSSLLSKWTLFTWMKWGFIQVFHTCDSLSCFVDYCKCFSLAWSAFYHVHCLTCNWFNFYLFIRAHLKYHSAKKLSPLVFFLCDLFISSHTVQWWEIKLNNMKMDLWFNIVKNIYISLFLSPQLLIQNVLTHMNKENRHESVVG